MTQPPCKMLISQFSTDELTEIYGPPGVVSRELLIWALDQSPRVHMGDPLRFWELVDEVAAEGRALFPECNWVWMAVQSPEHLARRFNFDLPKPSWEYELERYLAATANPGQADEPYMTLSEIIARCKKSGSAAHVD